VGIASIRHGDLSWVERKPRETFSPGNVRNCEIIDLQRGQVHRQVKAPINPAATHTGDACGVDEPSVQPGNAQLGQRGMIC